MRYEYQVQPCMESGMSDDRIEVIPCLPDDAEFFGVYRRQAGTNEPWDWQEDFDTFREAQDFVHKQQVIDAGN